VKHTDHVKAVKVAGLAWGNGDFFVPGFASHGRSGLVPGAPDLQRRRFLERAAIVEPQLLMTLRGVTPDDANGLLAWAKCWHLTDRWCLVLARDTARLYSTRPDAQGWEFRRQGIFVASFPFAIEPLQLEPFYHDPTWRSRRDFRRHVLEQVGHAVDGYCDRVEGAALAAGLKQAPRKRELEHFDWLVRYQVKGESFAYIAKTASYKIGGRQTVRKAVTELAKYLDLTLRPSTS
jgi:hypothetical protein